MIIDKTAKLTTLVDISFPLDERVVNKEDEKITNCKDLRLDCGR